MDFEKSSDVYVMAEGILLGSPFFSGGGAPYHATREQRRIEIEIGEVVSFACRGWLTYLWTLARKPAGSSALLSDARLRGIDRPGVYVAHCVAAGRWIRELELCAFTRADMYGVRIPNEEQRLQARGWLNDPTRTTDDVISRLEK
jgi:hypothetical protein